MKLQRKLMPLLASLCLFATISVARADDTRPPPPSGPEMGERCRENPDKCKEMKERMQNWCKEHADRCEEMKQKRQEMREECEKDPQACKQKREEMRDKFHQRMEEKCKQDPDKCAEWKQRHEHGDGPPDHDEPGATQ